MPQSAEEFWKAAEEVRRRKATRNGAAGGTRADSDPGGQSHEERAKTLGARLASATDISPPPPLLRGHLDPCGMSVLFGPGGVGKGTRAASDTTELEKLGHRVLIIDYENHPEEWGRRLAGLGCNLDHVMHVAPLDAGWTAERGPIWLNQEHLRALADGFGATYIVVDSIGYAVSGASPSDAEAATEYSAALGYIGRPSLSLAHVNRANDMTMPYGSMFFHASARITESMERFGEDQALITMRKANNYEKRGKHIFSSEWSDGRPTAVHETPFEDRLADRIHYMLSVMGPSPLSRLLESLRDEDEDGPAEKKTTKWAVKKIFERDGGKRFKTNGLKGPKAMWEAI